MTGNPLIYHLVTHGLARIRWETDADADWENLIGDMFDARHNPGILPETLQEQEEEYAEHVNAVGVWGCIIEVKDPDGEWQHASSLWGIVPSKDGVEYDDYCREVESDLGREALDLHIKLWGPDFDPEAPHKVWTVVAVYDDNGQTFVETVQAESATGAGFKVAYDTSGDPSKTVLSVFAGNHRDLWDGHGLMDRTSGEGV